MTTSIVHIGLSSSPLPSSPSLSPHEKCQPMWPDLPAPSPTSHHRRPPTPCQLRSTDLTPLLAAPQGTSSAPPRPRDRAKVRWEIVDHRRQHCRSPMVEFFHPVQRTGFFLVLSYLKNTQGSTFHSFPITLSLSLTTQVPHTMFRETAHNGIQLREIGIPEASYTHILHASSSSWRAATACLHRSLLNPWDATELSAALITWPWYKQWQMEDSQTELLRLF
jgi:hypothetical protein